MLNLSKKCPRNHGQKIILHCLFFIYITSIIIFIHPLCIYCVAWQTLLHASSLLQTPATCKHTQVFTNNKRNCNEFFVKPILSIMPVYFDSLLARKENCFSTDGYKLELTPVSSKQDSVTGNFEYNGQSYFETFDIFWIEPNQSFFGAGKNDLGRFAFQCVRNDNDTWSMRKTYSNMQHKTTLQKKKKEWSATGNNTSLTVRFNP